MRTRRLTWPDPSDAAFLALIGLGIVLVLVFTRGLSLFADDWDFVVNRPGLSAHSLLEPHGPHLSLVPILIYKVLLHLFGGNTYLPFRLLAAFDVVFMAIVIGWMGRRWWGRFWGLIPPALIVTLGPAGNSLLWSFQSGYAIALATGLIALLAFDRGNRRGDVIGCVALLVSLASASQGIGFTVGAIVMVLLAPGSRRRLWAVAIPALLYALWYAKYGSPHSETHLSLWPTTLPYAANSLSATFAPLLGLSSVSSTGVLSLSYGEPVAIAVLAVLAYALWRGWRPSRLFWGAAIALVVLWIAASLSDWGIFTRPPTSPRYLQTNAYLVLACLVAAVRLPRVSRRSATIVALLVAIVAATNAAQYSHARMSMYSSDIYSRAQLGAMLIMRQHLSPQFAPEVSEYPAFLVAVDAGNYLSTYDRLGILSDSPAQISDQPEGVKQAVDAEMARAELSRTVAPNAALTSKSARCSPLGRRGMTVRTSGGRYVVRSGRAPVSLTAGRFGSSDSVILGSVPARQTYQLTVISDRDPKVPWRIQLKGAGGRVCPEAGA